MNFLSVRWSENRVLNVQDVDSSPLLRGEDNSCDMQKEIIPTLINTNGNLTILALCDYYKRCIIVSLLN